MITGEHVQIRVSGTSLPFNNEPTIRVGNRYSIVDRGKKTWNQAKPIIINPTPTADDIYEIDFASGYIIFDKDKDRGEITVSGEYLPTSVLGVATGFSLDKGREFEDVTVFGSIDKREHPTFKTISGTLETLEVQNDYFMDKLEKGERVLLDFQLATKIETHWVYLDKVGVNAQPGIIKRDISFVGAR